MTSMYRRSTSCASRRPIVTDTIETPAYGSQARPSRCSSSGGSSRPGPPSTTSSTCSARPRPAATPRVSAGHEVRRADGALIKRMEPRAIAANAQGGVSRFSSMSLAGVAAGDYDLVLKVTDDATGRTDRAARALRAGAPCRWRRRLAIARLARPRPPSSSLASAQPPTVSAMQPPAGHRRGAGGTRGAQAHEAGELDEALDLYRRPARSNPNWDEGTLVHRLAALRAAALSRRPAPRLPRSASDSRRTRAPWRCAACASFSCDDTRRRCAACCARVSSASRSTPGIASVVRYHAGILLTRFGEFEVASSVLCRVGSRPRGEPGPDRRLRAQPAAHAAAAVRDAG